MAGRYGDAMIAVQPDAELGKQFDAAGGAGQAAHRSGRALLRPRRARRRKRALEQFRWFTGGWDVMAELPAPDHFASASKSVSEDDVAKQVPCGPDVDAHVEAVQAYVEAGFTHVALVQVEETRKTSSSAGPNASCCRRCGASESR